MSNQELQGPTSGGSGDCFMLACAATVDLFLLADVSGSVGAEGLESTRVFIRKLMAQMLLGRGEQQQLVGIVEVGGQAQIRTELTDSREKLEHGISSLTWDDTSAAALAPGLGAADTGFMDGRSNAKSTILLIVDGPVMHHAHAVQMARKISRYADLVVLLVAPPWDVAGMKGRRAREWLEAAGSCTPGHGCRLLTVKSYAALAETDVTAVVAELCPNLSRVQVVPVVVPAA